MTEPQPTAFAYPIMVEVRNAPVLVAGGGREAPAKVKTLTSLGAHVRLWCEAPAADWDARSSAVTAYSGEFQPALLDGARLAVVDTGDRELDRRIAAEARAKSVLVNVVDDPESCDWSAPAVLRRGDLTIAIASAGAAPALASRLRDQLRTVVGPEYGDFVSLLADVRPRIMATGRTLSDRRRLWYELVDGPALELLRAGRSIDAREAVAEIVLAWERRA